MGEQAHLGQLDEDAGNSGDRTRTESEEHYRLLYENSPLGYQSLDANGCIIEVNPAWLGILGYEREEVIGRWFGDFLDERGAALFRERFLRFKAAGHTEGVRFEMVCKDGRIIHVEIDGRVSYDPQGNFKQTHCVLRDITESLKVLQQLEEQRNRVQHYLNIAGTMFVALDTAGRATMVNRKTCEVLGYREEEILGKEWFGNFLPKEFCDDVRTTFRMLVRGELEPVEYFENPVLRSDGSDRIIQWHNSLIRNEVGHIIGTLSSGIDVTEERRAQEQLRRSEFHYRLLFENAGMGIGYYGPDGRAITFNRMALSYLGKTEDQVVGRSVLEIMPERGDVCMQRLQDAIEARRALSYVDFTHLATGNGWLSSIYTPIIHPDGSVEGVQVILHDITESKRAEEALVESETRFRGAFDHSAMGLALVSLDGHFISVNNATEEMLGYTRKELLDRDYASITHPDDLEFSHENFRRLLAEEYDHYHAEKRYLRKDGRVVWSRLTCALVQDVNRKPLYAIAQLQDITRQKQAELEREASVEFLRLVNESKNTHELIRGATSFFQDQSGCEAVGIRLKRGHDYPYYETRGFSKEFVLLENQLCAHDKQGNPILDGTGNPVLECMCGNVICGRFDPSKPFFTTKGSFWTNSTTELLAGTSETDRQARTRNRCNGEGYESVALIALRVGEERLGLLQLNDKRKGRFAPEAIAYWERLADYLAVALSKLMGEEELAKHQAEMAHLWRVNSIGEMASGLAHELNQPLCAVRNYAGAAKRLLVSESDEITTLDSVLDEIAHQTERAGDIIRRIRSLVGKHTPRRDKLDLNAVLNGVLGMQTGEVDSLNVDVRTDLSENLPIVEADQIEIEQVTLNLIRNALDAMSEIEPDRRYLSLQTGVDDEGRVFLRVCDTGKGLPEDSQCVFNSFYTTKENGLGIGLSLSRTIIETHGGKLTAANNPEGGACFTFRLPATRADLVS